MNMTRQNELNDVSPTSLNHLIGNRHITEAIRVALDAAHADNRPFDHCLCVGPAGVGKTQTAKVIAAEMASEFYEVLGQALEKASDLNALLLAAKDKDVIFIDEAALIPNEQQHALLIALDQRKIILAGGKTGRSPQSLPLANSTLVMATTDQYRLIPPLVDRMRLVLQFQFYQENELIEITRQRLRALNWPIDDEVLPLIASRSRGVPRLALRLAQAAWRVARSEGELLITAKHLERACLLEQLDALGLGPLEQQYLRMVKDGTSRLNVIASRLGLPARTVSQVTEQFLIRAGLVDKDEQGRRFLTRKGHAHLATSCPIDA
jgi:holliday junction DNA helicase RuvB